MSKSKLHLTRMRAALVALLGAGLVGCGGGGGGGDTPPTPTLIDLTSANMTSVAHAAAAGPYAFGAGGVSSVLGATPGGRVGEPGSSVISRVLATVLPALQPTLAAGRAHALATYPGQPEACPLGGTLTVIIDDADNDGQFDTGDTMTMVFDQCRTVDGTTDGQVAMTLTRVDPSPMAFGARMTMTLLSTASADGRHTAVTDGTAAMDYAVLDAARERLRMTAQGTVTVRLQTHQGVDDTVGLQDGYTYESVLDSAQRSMTDTFDGYFRSASAGGVARASTEAAFQNREADAFPWAGTMRVNGQHGTMFVRTLSADQVRLELDHNDCGVAEQTQTESWDWLM